MLTNPYTLQNPAFQTPAQPTGLSANWHFDPSQRLPLGPATMANAQAGMPMGATAVAAQGQHAPLPNDPAQMQQLQQMFANNSNLSALINALSNQGARNPEGGSFPSGNPQIPGVPEGGQQQPVVMPNTQNMLQAVRGQGYFGDPFQQQQMSGYQGY